MLVRCGGEMSIHGLILIAVGFQDLTPLFGNEHELANGRGVPGSYSARNSAN
jgi:hypothetical protein